MKSSLRFEFSLARRFLEENRSQTLLIILGIAIGVAVMVFLSALIDGLQANLIDKTVGRSPHIVISNDENAAAGAVKSKDGDRVLLLDATRKTMRPIVEWRNITNDLAADRRIKTVLPVVEGSGLIERGQVSRAILLKGFDLVKADQIYDISDSFVDGSPNIRDGAVLIGKDLAADLGVGAGEPIKLALSGRDSLTVVVDGVFDLGISSVNQRWLVMDQRRAAALLGLGDRINTIEMQVYDVLSADALAREWALRLPGYEVVSWQESNASLLAGLRSQSSSSYTIQFFVMMAVILGVASVLAISAVQKSKQIGILKAMGIRTASVSRVFMIQGLALGMGGTAGGLGLGLLMSKAFIVLAQQDYSLLLRPFTAAVIISATVLSATLAAYLPARQVSKIDPIEVIRNN
ncbi:MAG: ABC-type transport system, involved in lipoprotein release, permease component [Firmicutes bacterium]|nr:ABC-type transport system, involved in lipoprotein release, permease component [Bacillota bacterium]